MINPLENCLLLLGVPIALLLAGYWLAAKFTTADPSERLSIALVAGCCVLTWNVSVVGFFRPLSGLWAWVCLWPMALALGSSATRRHLAADLRAILGQRQTLTVAATAGLLLVVLLWPLLSNPNLVYYDGTSSHDAFLWISNAEHLKRHSYMEMPSVTATHPYAYTAGAIVGWRPPWGRMGAEGLFTLVSSLVGLSPVKVYLGATASALWLWAAAVYLVCRTFLVQRWGTAASIALLGVPSLFVFFHGNANLPNLFGAITGGTLLVAFERCLRAPEHRAAWRVLVALAGHALLCSYPEMWPFIALPCGLLWLRAAAIASPSRTNRNLSLALAAAAAGLLLNVATTARAWYGFWEVLQLARTADNWGNLFATLHWAHYPAVLVTLSLKAAKLLGPLGAGAVAVVVFIAAGFTFVRAKDRFGSAAMLAGGLVLALYTVFVGFGYGWQKTAQFAAPFLAAAIPVGAVQILWDLGGASSTRRWAARSLALSLIVFFGWATYWNVRDEHKWSQQKVITRDWFALRDYARSHAEIRTIVIEQATFSTAFFHGMWSTYFLQTVPVRFAARGDLVGGYLREIVAREADGVPPDSPLLVSRSWADAFDANSERLFTSDAVVLLRRSNRVSLLVGADPGNGVPSGTDGELSLSITPHSPATLTVTLNPNDGSLATTRWRLRHSVGDGVPLERAITSPPPWTMRIPLTAGQQNDIAIDADLVTKVGDAPGYRIDEIRLRPTRP